MAQEQNITVTQEDAEIGTVRIADEVVATIVAYAAMEVEGISSLSGNITADEIAAAGYKKLSKAVKVEVTGETVQVNIEVILGFGYNIPSTCSQLQTRIKNAIANMTGLTASDINIRIAGIAGMN